MSMYTDERSSTPGIIPVVQDERMSGNYSASPGTVTIVRVSLHDSLASVRSTFCRREGGMSTRIVHIGDILIKAS